MFDRENVAFLFPQTANVCYSIFWRSITAFLYYNICIVIEFRLDVKLSAPLMSRYRDLEHHNQLKLILLKR